jgi:hypothetical protein
MKVAEIFSELGLERVVDTPDGGYQRWDARVTLELFELVPRTGADAEATTDKQLLAEYFPTGLGDREVADGGWSFPADQPRARSDNPAGRPAKGQRTLAEAVKEIVSITGMGIEQIRECKSKGRPRKGADKESDRIDDALLAMLPHWSAAILGEAIDIARSKVYARAKRRRAKMPRFTDSTEIMRRLGPREPRTLWQDYELIRWLKSYETKGQNGKSDWVPRRATAWQGVGTTIPGNRIGLDESTSLDEVEALRDEVAAAALLELEGPRLD